MTKEGWIAVIGAISAAVVALITSLSGYGDHAPGIVVALLIGAPILTLDAILQRRINLLMEQALKREDDYTEMTRSIALFMEKESQAIAEIAREQGMKTLMTRYLEEKAAEARINAAATVANAVSDRAAAVAREVVIEAAAAAKVVNDGKDSGTS